MAVFTALLLIISVLSACGGGGESETTATAPLTKAEFEKKAKAICEAERLKYLQEAFTTLEQKEKESGKSKQELEAANVATVLVSSLERKIERVRQLGIPKGDEKQVEKILNAIREVGEEAQEDPERFMNRQSHFKHPFHRANQLARGYGLAACAKA